MDYYSISDRQILKELGKRLKVARINRNISQVELAERIGITSGTVHNAEKGKPASMMVWVAMLRAMGMLDQLDNFMPIQLISPIMLAEAQGRQRQRASKKRTITKKKDESEW
jgi:transcriptional regulator with XRE-family HTH domain